MRPPRSAPQTRQNSVRIPTPCNPWSPKNSDPLLTGYLPGGSRARGLTGTAASTAIKPATAILLFPTPKDGNQLVLDESTHSFFFFKARQKHRKEFIARNAGRKEGGEGTSIPAVGKL